MKFLSVGKLTVLTGSHIDILTDTFNLLSPVLSFYLSCYRNKYTTQEKKSGYKVVMVLTVHNVTKTDIGTYTCIASNTVGKADASIRIYGKYGAIYPGYKQIVILGGYGAELNEVVMITAQD